MITATAPNLWAVAGLVYALAGAGLLCSAVFSYDTLFAVAGSDRKTQKSQLAQKLDARLGALLLFLGFFFQASGLVGGAALETPGALMLLGLALGLLVYLLAKDLMIEQAVTMTAVDSSPAPLRIEPVIKSEPVIVVADVAPLPVKTERLRVVASGEDG